MNEPTVKKATAKWLSECFNCSFCHGDTLTQYLVDDIKGRRFIDSSDSESILRELLRRQWIRKTSFQPTRNQLSWGIGGLTGNCLNKHDQYYLSAWGFEPNRDFTSAVNDYLSTQV